MIQLVYSKDFITSLEWHDGTSIGNPVSLCILIYVAGCIASCTIEGSDYRDTGHSLILLIFVLFLFLLMLLPFPITLLRACEHCVKIPIKGGYLS